jgi:hypothetical protein
MPEVVQSDPFDAVRVQAEFVARVVDSSEGVATVLRSSAAGREPCLGALPVERRKPPGYRGFSEVGGTGLEPVTPSLSSWCSPN